MFPYYFIWKDPQKGFENLKSQILKDIKENNFDSYVFEEYRDEKKQLEVKNKQLQKHIELLTLELETLKKKKKKKKKKKDKKVDKRT
jgi:predicted RNase H-like nuclease (RuvC/YqgF family)